MAAIRSRSGSRGNRRGSPGQVGATVPPRESARVLALALAVAAAFGPARAHAAAPLRDALVVWHDDDRHDIAEPKGRDPDLVWTGIEDTAFQPIGRLTHPGRLVRRIGTAFGGDHVPAAANVNALDEAPNSSWFTNRIGVFPMTPDEAARGPADGAPPDRSAPWTVVRAKTEGVTPGFSIRDAKGVVYFIKFDPPGDLGTASGAAVISQRIFHAAGYNVPDDGVTTFRRDELVLGDNVKITLPDGTKRAMTEADLEAILARLDQNADGSWRAITSRLLTGKPIGPFDYRGRRKDDPNDRINHEDRRELRGLRLISAWLNHFDTKQQNSLDMFVEEGGRHSVRHHLIDFASTLGSGASGPSARYGYEYSLDPPAIAGRILALGLHEDAWRRVRRPTGLDEIGYFVSDPFDPIEFKPLQPNPAFANLTDRDSYWAAKIVSAFSDAHLEAIVARAEYQNPEAARTMTRLLAARRDKVAQYAFDRVPPLDFFVIDSSGVLAFHDLGAERGIYPSARNRYRVRATAAGADRGTGRWSAWVESETPMTRLNSGEFREALGEPRLGRPDEHRPPFLALECEVDRGAGWSRPVTVYIARASARIVAVER